MAIVKSQSYAHGNPTLIDVGYRHRLTRKGRRFIATHQTLGTDITGQTSLVATTPTFLLYQASEATLIAINSIVLSQSGTVAGGLIDLVVGIDNTNRFSAGGTVVTPSNLLAGDATTANSTFRTNPTATAAGTTDYIFNRTVAASLGAVSVLDIGDEVVIPQTGSLVIHTAASGTGPSWRFEVDYTEIDP